MDTTTITNEFHLDATPEEVYSTLVDSAKHTELTGEDASISRTKGGKFSSFGDWVNGEVVELDPEVKFSFTWVPDEEGWPKGHSSLVTFEFSEENGGTKVKFTHENLPDNIHEDFEKGWEEYYFKPLKEKFNKAGG